MVREEEKRGRERTGAEERKGGGRKKEVERKVKRKRGEDWKKRREGKEG